MSVAAENLSTLGEAQISNSALISSQVSGFDLLPNRPQQLADAFLIRGDADRLKEQRAAQLSNR